MIIRVVIMFIQRKQRKKQTAEVYRTITEYLGMNEIPQIPTNIINYYNVNTTVEPFLNNGFMGIRGTTKNKRLPIWEFRSMIFLENYNIMTPKKADDMVRRVSNEEMNFILNSMTRIINDMKETVKRLEDEIRETIKEVEGNTVRIPIKVILHYIASNMDCTSCDREVVEEYGEIYLKITVYRTGNKNASPVQFIGRKFRSNVVFRVIKKK